MSILKDIEFLFNEMVQASGTKKLFQQVLRFKDQHSFFGIN